MRKFVVALLISVFSLCVFAGQFHTVPLSDSSYKIIRYAELSGIIPLQSDVKPYTLNTVKNLLVQVMDSNQISESERTEIRVILEKLEKTYGTAEQNGTETFFKKGSIGFSGPIGNIRIGVKADSDNRVGIDSDKDKKISSRNLGTAFIMGDIKNWLSYDMNFSLVIDKLDTATYNFNDFEFRSDGQYFIGGLNTVYNLDGEEGIGVGLSYSPEITTSLFDDSLRLLAGSYKRDWGPGINNLGLSGSASKFEAFEIQYQPTSWFRFSSLVGSLGVTLFETAYGRELPTDRQTFDNNFSIQRAEFTVGNFKADVYESVVWKKRFELTYISPVSVYWIAQNFQGDWDSLLGGVDFSYRFPGFGRAYLGLAIDEFTSDIKHLFTNPRNMIAIQGGLEIALGFLDFGLLTIQGTYIPPFFGAHYAETRQSWGTYTSEYANGGKGLSYPLNPDSIELLLGFSCAFGKGWSLDIKVKDQIQSAQYTQVAGFNKDNSFGTLTNAGLNLNDAMDYGAEYEGKYALKDFFSYVWKNTLDVDLTVKKAFKDFPLELRAGANVIADWTRNFTNGDDNYGDKVSLQDWNSPYLRLLMKLGFSVYY
jgi:hypothetical protein